MQQLEQLAARVRVRNRGGGEGDGEPNTLLVWLIIGGVVLAIIIGITLLVIITKRKTLKRIEIYFGPEGLSFIQSLDPATRKAFIEITSAIHLTDQQIKDRAYNLDGIITGFVMPYSDTIKRNESLGWYRFLPYELDAIIAYAKGNQENAKANLKKAKELRGDGALMSESAGLIDI